MARESLGDNAVPLRLYLLGSFRLDRAGKSIRLPTHKTESLLAYLALHPKETGHAREKLAALFWGDSTDELARSSLRRALVLLRQALGDDVFLTSRDTVQIDPAFPLWVDALELEAQAGQLLKEPPSDSVPSTIALYRGDLLTDFYDEWVPPLREHFRTLFLESLLRLTEHARQKGEYERAVEQARTVLQRDPSNETAHQHLMFCYWKLGKRSFALSQYQECKRMLEQELGVEPSAETAALYRSIREQVATAAVPESPSPKLPVPLTRFVGRMNELAEVKRLLTTTRLLTLTGAGGSGKTRLAIQVCVDLQNDLAGEVGWVELARLVDPTLLPHTVAQALGVYETADRPLEAKVSNYLREKRFLLVLDNCEHLVEACAEFAEMLLRECPQLRILTTSRQLLNVAGETAWIVPSLAMPAPDQQMPPENDQNDAIQLFVERARAVQPGFALTAQNWQKVDTICRRLDGIPLAIELAASRTKVLTVDEIESYLDQRFQLLVGGNRTALPRHRTLRATMDWSYSLLSETEKVLFRRLSVFTGGFTLDSARHVCGREPLNPGDVLALLSDLIDKSLVLVREHAGASRYRLLETIRQYALERLLESNEGDRFYELFLDHMLELANGAEPKLVGPEQKVWLQRLEEEQDNLRTALHRALENAWWLDKGVRLASSLWRFWWYRGDFNEGQSWLARMLAIRPVLPGEKDPSRVAAFARLACLTWLQDDFLAARPLLEQAARSSQELGEKETCAYALAWLSMLTNDQGEFELAERHAVTSLELFRQTEDRWGRGYALFVGGRAALSLGNLGEARARYEASVNLFRELGERWGLALPLGHLGIVSYHQGEHVAARSLLEERLSIAREFGSKQLIRFALGYLARLSLHRHEEGQARSALVEAIQLAQETDSGAAVTFALEGFAALCESLGESRRAVQLLAAAEAQLQTLVASRDPHQQREIEILLEDIKSRMDENEFAEAWAEGHAMPVEKSIEYALNPA